MATKKIDYINKIDNNDDPILGYVLAADLNQIKLVVNNNADEITNQINDSSDSLLKTWSSNKIKTELSKASSIDDTVIDVAKVWSSQKTNTEIQKLDIMIFEDIVDVDGLVNNF